MSLDFSGQMGLIFSISNRLTAILRRLTPNLRSSLSFARNSQTLDRFSDFLQTNTIVADLVYSLVSEAPYQWGP